MKKQIRAIIILPLLLGLGLTFLFLSKTAIAADPVTLRVYNPTGSFDVTQTFAPG